MKVIAFAIAIFISMISAYVSWSVLSSISFVYGLIAIAFEAAKPFLIYSCTVHWRGGYTNRAVVLGVIAVCLSVVSVFTGVAMLENGVNTMKTESEQYKNTLEQIDRLVITAEQQRKANQITKAVQTEDKITELTASLPSKQAHNAVSEYGKPMAVVISVLCESVVAAVIMSVGKLSGVDARVHIENMNNNIQVNALVHVQESILRGETRPSFRGVTSNFEGLRREDIRSMFQEMLARGEIKPHGKGYKLS